MTIVALWYRQKYQSLWCAADSRVSNTQGGIITDYGPKVLPIPVTQHRHFGGAKWSVTNHHSFGFAYAGSTLAAICTHALVTAATQSLTEPQQHSTHVKLESVASLLRSISEKCIIEMSSRLGSSRKVSDFFFESLVFGFCHSEKKFKAFQLTPNIINGALQVQKDECILTPNNYFLIGSGKQKFNELHNKMSALDPNHGLFLTFVESLKEQNIKDIGGYIQTGISDRKGFRIPPIIHDGDGPGDRRICFLGFEANSLSKHLNGHGIGYEAVRPTFG